MDTNFLAIVVFPAPDGDDIITNLPLFFFLTKKTILMRDFQQIL